MGAGEKDVEKSIEKHRVFDSTSACNVAIV